MKAELTVEELRAINTALIKASVACAGNADAIRYVNVAENFVKRKLREIETTANLEKHTWDRWCGSYGLRPEDFGTQFFLKGRAYEILSLNPSAPKYAVNAKRLPDGKVFRVPPDCVVRGLPRRAA